MGFSVPHCLQLPYIVALNEISICWGGTKIGKTRNFISPQWCKYKHVNHILLSDRVSPPPPPPKQNKTKKTCFETFSLFLRNTSHLYPGIHMDVSLTRATSLNCHKHFLPTNHISTWQQSLFPEAAHFHPGNSCPQKTLCYGPKYKLPIF